MLKEKPRLVELRLALILNYVAGGAGKEKINNILYFLKTYAIMLNKENDALFNSVLANSINNNLLLASKKELALTAAVYYKTEYKAIKLLRITSHMYKTLYPDIKTQVTQEYLDSLEARYAVFEKYYKLCTAVSELYDNFSMYYTYKEHPLKETYRHTELKFRYIYDNLYKMFNDTEKTNEFILTYCRNLKIDTAAIGKLLDNFDLIYRGFKNPLDSIHVSKELVTFGNIEGWSSGKIATKVFNKPQHFLQGKNLINSDETENAHFIDNWYQPVIIFDLLSAREVQRFITAVGDFNDR